jgi:MFS family permease
VTGSRAGRLAYAAFLALATIDASGYGIIGPVVPAISEATSSGPGVTGLLVATFAVGMSAGFALAGVAIHRYGAAPVLAVSVALLALGAVCFVTVESLGLYFAGRLLMGLGSGGLWLGIAIGVIERWPGEEFKRLSGIMAMYSVGGIAGPALGAIGGIRAPFLAYLGVVAVAVLALLALGPPHEQVAEFRSDRQVLRAPGFLLSSAGTLMVALVIGSFDGTLPLHFDSLLSQAEIGALYVLASLLLAFWAFAASRFPVRPTLYVATVLIVAGLALAGAGEQVWVWIAALVLAATGFGLAETSSIGILLETVGTERIVLAMAVWSQVFALGYLIGPAVGGAIVETLGFDALGLLPFAFALLVLWAAVVERRAQGTPAGESVMRSRL